MRQGWEIRKLGDVIELVYGKPLPDEKRHQNGTYPIYGANGEKGRTNEFYHNKKSIIVGRKGSAGELNLTEEKFWPLDVTYFVKYNEKKNDLIFLYYLLSLLELPKLAKGVKPGINRNEVYSINVQIPPLKEQQHIVAILKETFAYIDKAKANADQNLKNAKELFESYLQGVFEEKGEGWEEKKLREVCEYEKNQNLHKNLPYVGLEHIESNTGAFLGSIEPQEVKSSTFHFNEQHVLYGRLRPYLNKVLLPNFEGHCSTEIFPIQVNKEISREFLFYWLITGTTVKKINSTWTGTRMPRANMHQVLEFDFAFPSIKEQQIIVRKLDAVRAETQKLGAMYQRKIVCMEELKNAILQKAFMGELITTKATPI